jgi:hypothetical protein
MEKKMKKMKKNYILLIVILTAISLFVGCFKDEGQDEITINITCTKTTGSVNAGFSGYYLEDGEYKSFALTDYVDTSDDLKVYEKDLDDVDYVYVLAVKDDADLVLSIQIFRDGRPVKSITSSSGSNGIITLEYEYSEDESDSSE